MDKLEVSENTRVKKSGGMNGFQVLRREIGTGSVSDGDGRKCRKTSAKKCSSVGFRI